MSGQLFECETCGESYENGGHTCTTVILPLTGNANKLVSYVEYMKDADPTQFIVETTVTANTDITLDVLIYKIQNDKDFDVSPYLYDDITAEQWWERYHNAITKWNKFVKSMNHVAHSF